MLNCRSISPEAWEQARKLLVFYFSRGHARLDAENLAQETLLALLTREDYEFEKEEDFIKVVRGFARNILKDGYRRMHRDQALPLSDSIPAPHHGDGSARAMNARIFLKQVLGRAKRGLGQPDWDLLLKVLRSPESRSAGQDVKAANRERVQVFRLRKKLAQLFGLAKELGESESGN